MGNLIGVNMMPLGGNRSESIAGVVPVLKQHAGETSSDESVHYEVALQDVAYKRLMGSVLKKPYGR